VLAGLASGCGNGGQHAAVSVRVSVKSYFFGTAHFAKPQTRSYALTCGPVGGTLPYAGRICADIARHPQPMLDPLPARFGCSGSPNMAQVTVTSTKNGKTTTFSAAPDCTWPDGIGAAVYFLAASEKPHWLALTEKRLRCEDDPALLVRPTPMLSVFACNHNLWTPRAAKLIRIAKNTPVIRALDGSKLFPTQIGDRECVIHGGGPAPGVVFHGVCEVTVKRVWSTPTVSFVESWSEGGKRWHAGERLVIKREQVISAQHIGVNPPQLWH
jgi:hypothetical protein